jgi:hypothetical protein
VTDQIQPGDAVIYMKVGMHAQESLEDILERKQAEIDRVGFGMWGYGGPTCHPRNSVQSLARQCQQAGQVIRLVMEPVNSRHARAPERASHYSLDNETWHEIPNGINVLGSRFALCINNLRETEEQLSLGATTVAVGPSQGKIGAVYIQGQVDKACLRVVNHEEPGRVASIKLAADLIDPWAVFVR